MKSHKQFYRNLDDEKRGTLGYSTCEALPIPHLHDWRKMEVCLINLNKGEDDEGFF
jgi:hypothetical protein